MPKKRKSAEEKFDDDQPSTSKKARSERNLRFDSQSSEARGRCVASSSSRSMQRSNVVPGFEEKPGRIVSLRLRNFMCHGHLYLELHPRINFLVGTNGSGKSACLAALQIGLGAKARETNRSNHIANFIKTGETSAKIEIVLSNEGACSYQPQTYGKRITVVRNITKAASTFVVKNEHGEVMTRKRADLERLLLCLNVQADNAVFVLTQDDAKTLLKTSDPKKSYKLFTKAIQYDFVQEKIKLSLDEVNRQKTIVDGRAHSLIQKKKEIDKLNEQLKQVQSIDNLKETLKKLETQKLWRVVEGQESVVAAIDEEINKIQTEIEENNDFIAQRTELEIATRNQIEELSRQVDLLTAEYTTENDKYEALKRKNVELQRAYNQLEANKRCEQNIINNCERDIKELEAFIEKHSDIGTVLENREKTESNMNSLKEKIVKINEMQDNLRKEIAIHESNFAAVQDSTTKLKEQQSVLRTQNDRRTDAINKMRSTARNKYAVYGHSYIALMAEIEKQYKAGKFNEKPRGPIGSYIEVPNAKHLTVVEHLLSNVLKTFVVNDRKDRETLLKICRVKMPNEPAPDIITNKFKKNLYDVRKGCVTPPPGTVLLLNEIKCKDSVVMNCIIDYCKVERLLLTDTRTTAENITSVKENVPTNLLKVVVIECHSEYFPDPNYRVYSMKKQLPRYIQTNVEDAIKQLEHKNQMTIESLQQLEQQKITLARNINTEKIEYQEKKKKLVDYIELRTSLVSKLHEFENQEYTEHTQIDTLSKDLATRKLSLESSVKKLEEVKVDVEKKRIECDELNEKIKCQKSQMNIVAGKLNQRQQSKLDADAKKRELKSNYVEVKRKQQALQSQLQKQQAKRDAEQINLEREISAANVKGERIQTRKSIEQLNNRINSLKSAITCSSRITVNAEELKNQLTRLTREHDEAEEINTEFKSVLNALSKTLIHRSNFASVLRDHSCMVVQYTFQGFMNLRKFKGEMKIDNKTKNLHLTVVPRDTETEGAVSNVKSLSGGEHSYSTVSFLLSLWNAVDHPFYFLDEYDVFTDTVNRETITRLLIMEAKGQQNNQFVFLTPQDMNMLCDENIKIHRFDDPTRR